MELASVPGLTANYKTAAYIVMLVGYIQNDAKRNCSKRGCQHEKTVTPKRTTIKQQTSVAEYDRTEQWMHLDAVQEELKHRLKIRLQSTTGLCAIYKHPYKGFTKPISPSLYLLHLAISSARSWANTGRGKTERWAIETSKEKASSTVAQKEINGAKHIESTNRTACRN